MIDVFDKEVYRDQLYTEQQSRLLTNLPRITAPLSILGSSIIVYIIVKDRQHKLQRVYHRLLLAYSSIDILCSINYAVSAAVVPKGTPGVYGAHGNITTCEVSGFVTQFSFALGIYGSFLCLYYVLVLRYHVKEYFLAKYIEPVVHGIALIVPLIIGIIMLQKGTYNPTNVMIGWCFINVYPMDCLRRKDPITNELLIDCERGQDYLPWLLINNIPFFPLFVIVALSCILTYWKVQSVEHRSSRWTFTNTILQTQTTPSSSTSLRSLRQQASTRNRTSPSASAVRVRESATQAFLYIAAFTMTYLFFGIGTLFGPKPATMKHRNFYFPIVVLTKIFLPLQGFWNCFIYIRPRYNSLRIRYKTISRWRIFHAIVTSQNVPTTTTNSSSGKRPTSGLRSSNNSNNPVTPTMMRQWVMKTNSSRRLLGHGSSKNSSFLEEDVKGTTTSCAAADNDGEEKKEEVGEEVILHSSSKTSPNSSRSWLSKMKRYFRRNHTTTTTVSQSTPSHGRNDGGDGCNGRGNHQDEFLPEFDDISTFYDLNGASTTTAATAFHTNNNDGEGRTRSRPQDVEEGQDRQHVMVEQQQQDYTETITEDHHDEDDVVVVALEDDDTLQGNSIDDASPKRPISNTPATQWSTGVLKVEDDNNNDQRNDDTSSKDNSSSHDDDDDDFVDHRKSYREGEFSFHQSIPSHQKTRQDDVTFTSKNNSLSTHSNESIDMGERMLLPPSSSSARQTIQSGLPTTRKSPNQTVVDGNHGIDETVDIPDGHNDGRIVVQALNGGRRRSSIDAAGRIHHEG